MYFYFQITKLRKLNVIDNLVLLKLKLMNVNV